MISTRNKGLDFPLEMKGSLSYIKLDKSKGYTSNGMCVKHLIMPNFKIALHNLGQLEFKQGVTQ